MAVHSSDLKAARALHIHKVTIRRLDHALQFVLALLLLRIRVQKVDVHGCCLEYAGQG